MPMSMSKLGNMIYGGLILNERRSVFFYFKEIELEGIKKNTAAPQLGMMKEYSGRVELDRFLLTQLEKERDYRFY